MKHLTYTKSNSNNSASQPHPSKLYEKLPALRKAIEQHRNTDCFNLLESLGIPYDWAVLLLPLIQAEMVGGIQ